MKNVKKELGDLLLHVIFYSKIASEEGAFDIADVADTECDKLIFRHPMFSVPCMPIRPTK